MSQHSLQDDLGLSLPEIERALAPFRSARRQIISYLLEELIGCNRVEDPYLLLTRLFCRQKSADSILEKIHRKGLDISSAAEIPEKMPDVLGLRIVTKSLKELWKISALFEKLERFKIESKDEYVNHPRRYGEQSIEYTLLFDGQDFTVPLEVQLRTFLQHIWASETFFLFHKQPESRREPRQSTLVAMSKAMQAAEKEAANLAEIKGRPEPLAEPTINFARLPICANVNLMAFEAEERFAEHVVVPLSGDDTADHLAIVDRKINLYQHYPTVVECACMGFQTFAFNEPHIKIPQSRLDRIRW